MNTIQENTSWVPGKSPVDFWAIFNGLLPSVHHAETNNFTERLNLSPATEIREYRTIGMKVIRQTGKTCWVCDFLNHYPKAVAIVSNLSHKQQMGNMTDFQGNPIPHVKPEDMGRVFTAKGIEDCYADTGILEGTYPIELLNADFILVDEAYHTYGVRERFGQRQLADIINKRFTHKPIIVEIN